MTATFPKNIFPAALVPGNTIGIVAPASPVTRLALQQGVAYLEAMGYRVKVGEHCTKRHGFLAGTDEQRAADINAMFRNSDIDALFCARGGYGTPRLLDMIDYDAVRAYPKIVLGYSDITALQWALYAQTGLVTYYGPLSAVELKENMPRFTERSMWRVITGSMADKMCATQIGWAVYREGKCSGPFVGGCLSLITSLLGTPYFPELNGAILFIEDINEDPYEIDRMFQQLRLAGVLDKLQGLVIGRMPGCTPRKKPSFTLHEVWQNIATYIRGPVLGNADFGHVDAKLTLPSGCIATIDSSTTNIIFPHGIIQV